jgi:hypothetical protein
MQGITVNLQTGSVTELRNFNFLSIYEVGGVTYGVREDGIYEISSDITSDNEESLFSRFVCGYVTLANFHRKRVASVYIDQVGDIVKPITVIIRYDNDADLKYTQTQKVVPGKGADGYSVAFGAESKYPFSVYSITYLLHERQRRGRRGA